jgi:peptidyl-prolyl cis-trans isomerase C
MSTRKQGKTVGCAPLRILWIGLEVCLALSTSLLAQMPSLPRVSRDRVAARVNGVVITEAEVRDEMEALYPSNTAHGGIQPERLKELRSQALEELIVQELAYQQAVRTQALAPLPEVRSEYQRMRAKHGPGTFDRSLQASGLTRQQYLKKLQRRLTLERLTKQKVYLPSRVGSQALRAYYRQNLRKFQRPERVRTRLILAAVDPKASPEEERQAREKIDKVYQQLRAGKDFATLAQQDSDDFYRVKGGDVGWMHRGSMEPAFEKVALSLPPGQFSPPFRTSYGYNVMKVDGREPARLMKFEEVRERLKSELEDKRFRELRRAWVGQLKKGAKVEILESETASAPHAVH